MRAIDPGLQASLDSGATTLCRCWRVRRRDGVVFGFTDHDMALGFEDTEFRASSGLDTTEIETATGFSVDNAQVMGALTDAAITEDDIKAGRYDGAAVDQWLVDWTDTARRAKLFHGTIGEIRRTETAFEVELRGPTEILNVPVGRTIKRTCDRVVGDAKCGVDLGVPAYRFASEAAGPAVDGRIASVASGGHALDWFTGGVLRWITGANSGIVAAIRSDRVEGTGRVFDLAEEPALPVAAGDRFEVTAGCDRRAETCRTKFGNFLNFRGFPHVPGDDWVVAYPKSGEVHDGASLVRR
jgi:uncharacterized phage protein (TIGR02218 family)